MFQVSVEKVRGGDKEHVQGIQGAAVTADNIERVEEDVRRADNKVQKITVIHSTKLHNLSISSIKNLLV